MDVAYPQRIQRQRTKGFRLPPDCIYVGRPTKWGNPFTVEAYGRTQAVAKFREALMCHPEQLGFTRADLAQLRGKPLACYCPISSPCHADCLIEFSNAPG